MVGEKAGGPRPPREEVGSPGARRPAAPRRGGCPRRRSSGSESGDGGVPARYRRRSGRRLQPTCLKSARKTEYRACFEADGWPLAADPPAVAAGLALHFEVTLRRPHHASMMRRTSGGAFATQTGISSERLTSGEPVPKPGGVEIVGLPVYNKRCKMGAEEGEAATMKGTPSGGAALHRWAGGRRSSSDAGARPGIHRCGRVPQKPVGGRRSSLSGSRFAVELASGASMRVRRTHQRKPVTSVAGSPPSPPSRLGHQHLRSLFHPVGVARVPLLVGDRHSHFQSTTEFFHSSSTSLSGVSLTRVRQRPLATFAGFI